MNNVSLLLYAADVLSNVAVIFGIFITALVIFSGVWMIIASVEYYDNGRDKHPARNLFWIVPIVLVVSLILAFIPSRTTLLSIATSEFVEDFSQTETGTEIGALANDTLKLLRKELDKLNTPSE